jgi:hypothetical protein
MVLGWIEEDGNWTEITGQIPFSTASAGSSTFIGFGFDNVTMTRSQENWPAWQDTGIPP